MVPARGEGAWTGDFRAVQPVTLSAIFLRDTNSMKRQRPGQARHDDMFARRPEHNLQRCSKQLGLLESVLAIESWLEQEIHRVATQ